MKTRFISLTFIDSIDSFIINYLYIFLVCFPSLFRYRYCLFNNNFFNYDWKRIIIIIITTTTIRLHFIYVIIYPIDVTVNPCEYVGFSFRARCSPRYDTDLMIFWHKWSSGVALWVDLINKIVKDRIEWKDFLFIFPSSICNYTDLRKM